MDTAVALLSQPGSAPSRMARPRLRGGGPVLVAAVFLIVAQLLVRWWVADSGYFYWDDLIVVSRAARYPLWSEDLLLFDHDGHLMPLAFGTAWVVTAVAPLAWAGPMVSLLVLQLAVSVAVLRMLIVLRGARPTILVPLVFFLFSPVTLPAFAWWAAALNALPLQFALAWVIGDAVLLSRGGRVRYAVSGILVSAVALLFFEKSVLVPIVAFAVAVLARYVERDEGFKGAVATVARRGATLWIGSGFVLVFWFATYLTVVDISAVHRSPNELRALLPTATSFGVLPTLLGGPWSWERWLPSSPWADPPGWTVVAAWVAVGGSVAWSLRTRIRVGPVWMLAAIYLLVAQLPVALARSGPNTAAELMQSLRYFADAAVVLTSAVALLSGARPRDPRSTRHPGPRTVVGLTVLFLVSSLCSTYTFVSSWRAGSTRTYVTNVESALDRWDGVPLLEQEVPWTVLNPLAYPQNLASRVLAPIAPPGTFAASTPHLRMITDSGTIVDAVVWWNRSILPGPEPDCGYRIRGAEPARLPLDGPMLDHEWTAQLNYLASRDGRITVALEHGDTVAVPVEQGPNTVFVRIVGGGSVLRVGASTPGLHVCVGVGPVGVASYDY